MLSKDDFRSQNIYDFLDDVDKLASAFGFQVVQDNLQTCLRGAALEWYDRLDQEL